MTESPRPKAKPGRTTKQQSALSAPMLIFITALDTTWRMFIPPLVGTFLGIGLDQLFGIAPIATIVCLLAGAILSAILIIKQLRDVRRPLK